MKLHWDKRLDSINVLFWSLGNAPMLSVIPGRPHAEQVFHHLLAELWFILSFAWPTIMEHMSSPVRFRNNKKGKLKE